MRDEIETYLNYLRSNEYSENTIIAYRKALILFFDFLAERELSKDVLIEFKKALIGKRQMPATINLRINAVHSYLYFIGKDEFQVKLINVGQRNSLENVISMTDYLYLIDSLKNDGMYVLYALVRLLAATGLRISEALQVRYDHLQLGYIDLFLTKGNKYRRVWFPEKVAAEIVELMSDEKIANQFPNGRRGALFEPNNTGRDTAIRYYQNKLYRCGDRYHINKAVLHPHSFRHFFAKNFLLHNQDVSLLADLLGHSKIETTRIYLRQTKEEQRETVNRIVNW